MNDITLPALAASVVMVFFYYILLIRRFFSFTDIPNDDDRGKLLISRLFAMIIGAILSVLLWRALPIYELTTNAAKAALGTMSMWEALLWGAFAAVGGFVAATVLFFLAGAGRGASHRARSWILIIVFVLASVFMQFFAGSILCFNADKCVLTDGTLAYGTAIGISAYLMDYFARSRTESSVQPPQSPPGATPRRHARWPRG